MKGSRNNIFTTNQTTGWVPLSIEIGGLSQFINLFEFIWVLRNMKDSWASSWVRKILFILNQDHENQGHVASVWESFQNWSCELYRFVWHVRFSIGSWNLVLSVFKVCILQFSNLWNLFQIKIRRAISTSLSGLMIQRWDTVSNYWLHGAASHSVEIGFQRLNGGWGMWLDQSSQRESTVLWWTIKV